MPKFSAVLGHESCVSEGLGGSPVFPMVLRVHSMQQSDTKGVFSTPTFRLEYGIAVFTWLSILEARNGRVMARS